MAQLATEIIITLIRIQLCSFHIIGHPNAIIATLSCWWHCQVCGSATQHGTNVFVVHCLVIDRIANRETSHFLYSFSQPQFLAVLKVWLYECQCWSNGESTTLFQPEMSKQPSNWLKCRYIFGQNFNTNAFVDPLTIQTAWKMNYYHFGDHLSFLSFNLSSNWSKYCCFK